jgi:Putative Ig domain
MRRRAPSFEATRSLLLVAVSTMLLMLASGGAAASVRAAPLSVSGSANCTFAGGSYVNGVCNLPTGTVGQQDYAGYVVASGGSGTPFSFAVVAGALPPGLTMPSSFDPRSTLVTGTPIAQGTFPFTVKVTDRHGDTATGKFSLAVAPSPPLSITGPNCTADSGSELLGVCVLPGLSVDQGAELFIASSGGGGNIALWHFDIVAGSPPPGMSMPALYGHGDHSTIIAGTPSAQGTFAFTVRLTDGLGDTATGHFSLTVGQPPPLQVNPTGGCESGAVGSAYQQYFFAQGGVQPWTWSLVSGAFPPGLHLTSPYTPQDNNSVLAGSPTTAGIFTITMQVTDSQGSHATEPPCTITISP